MELEAQEWKEYFFLHCVIETPDSPDHCDGFGSAFSIYHTLNCKKGGLATARQNELCDGVFDLAIKAFTPKYTQAVPCGG